MVTARENGFKIITWKFTSMKYEKHKVMHLANRMMMIIDVIGKIKVYYLNSITNVVNRLQYLPHQEDGLNLLLQHISLF